MKARIPGAMDKGSMMKRIQQMQEDMQTRWHRKSLLYKTIIAVLLLAVATLAFYTVKIIIK